MSGTPGFRFIPRLPFLSFVFPKAGWLYIVILFPAFDARKDGQATKAMQAVNDSWEVLRDAMKRSEYNKKIIAQAIANEENAKKRKATSQIAASQKEQAQAAAKKANQKPAEQKPASKQKMGPSSTAAAASASSKPMPEQAPASAKDKSSSWVYCKLVEQRAAATCKSLLQAKLIRKFEHKQYAGAKHAVAVAEEFQKACESMMVEALSSKLEQLKSFCADNGIELPQGRLTRSYLADTIEEAALAPKTMCTVHK